MKSIFADTRAMDGRAQLQSLARAIGSAAEIEAAWAGTGPSVDVRKACGICGDEQPARVPFLRHVCRSCQSIWVPGICGDCAHTSVTFTLDGQLSRFATCGCGGALRQVAYVPKPRVAVDPEVAAARRVVIEQRKKHATWTSRTVLIVLTLLAVLGSVQLVRGHGPAPTQATDNSRGGAQDSPALTMTQRGALAAQRLRAQGRINDVFACAGQLPVQPTAAATPATTPATMPAAAVPSAPAVPAAPATTHEGFDAGSKAFLAGCLGH